MQASTPFFSIIIPTYNRVDSLKKTITSIYQQDFKDTEILIVDDGSTDTTKQEISIFHDTRLRYYKIKNSERGAARNVGLNKSSGKYINYFDSDDLYLPCLGSLKNFIEANMHPAVVYGDILNLRENGEVLLSESLPYTSFTKNLLHNNFLACGSVFLRHDVAKEFSFQVDRRLSSAEDWELWLRVHATYEFINFPAAVFQQVHHSERSLTRINPQKIEERDNYFASLVSNNEQLKKYYGERAINLFMADRFTFIALAWCRLSWSKAFLYWSKALFTSWKIVTRKRFWAVFKKLIFKR